MEWSLRVIRIETHKAPIMSPCTARHISHRFRALAVALAGAALVLAGATTSALAQQASVRGTYGFWEMRCATPPGASSEQCVLMQAVEDFDRSEIGLSVSAFKTADRQAQILRIQAPLGVLLPNGLGLHIDGRDMGRAYFVRCFSDGCYAEVILEPALLDSLKAGEMATFTVFDTPEEGIGLPVDLTGFTEGFEALP